MSRIAIIGAGPIGLEAALLARQLGHDVNVFEKGRVAENILDWGHVRLFSPFGMNSSEWGRGALAAFHGTNSLPGNNDLLTGFEFYDRYLLPLSELPELVEQIHEDCEVCSIGRKRFWKLDGVGDRNRVNDPFQILVRRHGAFIIERSRFDADIVLDCSGTYPNHNWLGAGGCPCVGEEQSLATHDYRVTAIQPELFREKTTLVVGAGYSAATAVIELAEVVATHPATRVIWITRPHLGCSTLNHEPIHRHPNDSLTLRDRIAQRVNELATSDNPAVLWKRDCCVMSIFVDRDSTKLHVAIESDQSDTDFPIGSHTERLVVDRIIANVGYRPDRSIYEELHVHECYATQGPIKLAAKLLGETSSDCLTQASHGCDVLKNPEPNFFILGSKSYGRNSNFLLRTGIEQVHEVLGSLPNASTE